MTQFGNFGIYSGGELNTVSPDKVTIAPYIIVTSGGEITGSGAPDDSPAVSKSVKLEFNQPSSQSYVTRSDLQIPTYSIKISSTGPGYCYIYYDEGLKDIALSNVVAGLPVPPANMIVFGTVSWPTGTTNISTVSIVNTYRRESYQAGSTAPQSSKHLYYDGLRWISGGKNRPLANISVLNEVLQAENALILGNEYFITLLKDTSIQAGTSGTGNPLKVSVLPFKSYARQSGDLFKAFNTKENPSISPACVSFTFPNLAAVQGQLIYISINKSTGVPTIGTSDPSATDYIVARSPVPISATDLDTVVWEIVNDLGGQVQTIHDLAKVVKSRTVSGFLSPARVVGINLDYTVRFQENTLNLQGYVLTIPDTDISLGNPPFSPGSSRQDFIYLKIQKNEMPFTRLTANFVVVNGVNLTNYQDPFFDTIAVGDTYTFTEEGHYVSSSGDFYAIPIALVHRYTGASWQLSEPNGGFDGTRPDGKWYKRSHDDEIENLAPCMLRTDKNAVLTGSLLKLLKGDLNRRLMPAEVSNSVLSRAPLQIDYIGGGAGIGYSLIGSNAVASRYVWNNIGEEEVWMYGMIKENLDHNDISNLYNFNGAVSYESSSRTLHLYAYEGLIVLDGTGQPKDLKIFWKDTGLPVEFTGPWAVGLPQNISNIILNGGTNYIAGGEIVIMYKMNYIVNTAARVGLRQIPKEIFDVRKNNSIGLNNQYAPALDSYYTGTKIRDLPSQTHVIGSVTYTDYIQLQKAGDVHKYHTYEYVYHAPGTASLVATIDVNDSIAGYQFCGVKEVRRLDGTAVEITQVKLVAGQFNIQLNENISTTEALQVVLGCGAGATGTGVNQVSDWKQIDFSVGSLGISNLTETEIPQGIVGSAMDGDARLVYADGRIIYGFSSLKALRTNPLLHSHGVWVNGEFAPVTVTGLNTNRIEIDLFIPDTIFSQLGLTLANWTNYTRGGTPGKKPANASTLEFPMLRSHILNHNSIYIYYKYGTLPFIPFKPVSGKYYNDSLTELRRSYLAGEGPQIASRGYVLITNDGLGNSRGSSYSPVSERFPVVQNSPIVGVDSPNANLGWNDVLIYQQLSKAFIEGELIEFNGVFILNISLDPNSGVVVWAAMVKQKSTLRMFVYEVRNGQFILDSTSQAFICELEENYREFQQ